jgi:K+-sensing histidine kinase KdpD
LRSAPKLILSLVAVGVAVLLLFPFAARINPTTVALALLLVILFIATIFGSRQALGASILAVLCFNFFFLPPFYTFHISDTENWVAFGAFVVTAIVAGQLSTYARRQAAESEERRVQIEGLYKELQDAFEQASEAEGLRRSEKLKSALLDAITHDLRTPLTSIKASATTLLESKSSKLLDEEGEVEFLEIIDEESDRLNQFIDGMVGLAQIEADALHLRKSWTTVQDLVDLSMERARPKLESYHILIELERELPAMFVDANSISEVLYLLLDNAGKYSAKGSSIRISARQAREGEIEVAVEDQGIGISRESREKVFQKFVRLKTSEVPSTGEGLGLGLAIAKGVVESQNGRIWIEDGTPGFVTRFVVALPIEEGETAK